MSLSDLDKVSDDVDRVSLYLAHPRNQILVNVSTTHHFKAEPPYVPAMTNKPLASNTAFASIA